MACFYEETCIMAFEAETTCQLFYYTSKPTYLIVLDSSADGIEETGVVAIKSNVSSCSTTFNFSFIFIPSEIENENYFWYKTFTGWAFQSCRFGWQRFDRNNGASIVCMKTVVSGTLEAAKQQCESLNSTLIGVASTQENDWMRNTVLQITNDETAMFWISGLRNVSKDEGSELIWTDGITTDNTTIALLNDITGESENCLAIQATETSSIINMNCGSGAPTGAFCGYKFI
ncbi:hypothetical protein CAEBREN_19186 [Caenorhabditis brenneri]|uniref:C-type lectin domain-containing protein n=1 Tax=Caenorhabditis brenneri TaxID=135651 RepID=G0NSS0_CAEBE|nr:hypothetical protein CAEBREN_19186 [Caenorhabditis brenneri]